MSRHILAITLTDLHGYTEVFTQEVESDDYDPENQTVGVLAAEAFDQLWHNTYVGIWLGEPDDLHEDCHVYMAFNGKPIADEWASHVQSDYMSDAWVAKHETKVAA